MQELFGDDFPGWGYDHAGIYETSALLYRKPEVVQFENAVDDKLGKMVYYDILTIPEKFRSESGCPMEIKACDCRNGETSMGNTTCDIK